LSPRSGLQISLSPRCVFVASRAANERAARDTGHRVAQTVSSVDNAQQRLPAARSRRPAHDRRAQIGVVDTLTSINGTPLATVTPTAADVVELPPRARAPTGYVPFRSPSCSTRPSKAVIISGPSASVEQELHADDAVVVEAVAAA
jgi:hypothetical protein